jgi:hypothetical protein
VSRSLALGALAIAVLCGAAAGLVAWATREAPSIAAEAAPAARTPAAVAEAPAIPAAPIAAALPLDPAARERALDANEARRLFEALRDGFALAERSERAEARLREALRRTAPRAAVECRRLVCRLEAPADSGGWREPLREPRVARELERSAVDPDEARLAYVELVEERLAEAPRPDGERILDEVEQGLLGSEAARRCVGEGGAGGAEIRLFVDASGVTYRFGAVDPAIGYCLMTQALPDVLATVQAPGGVRRAERSVRIPAG